MAAGLGNPVRVCACVPHDDVVMKAAEITIFPKRSQLIFHVFMIVRVPVHARFFQFYLTGQSEPAECHMQTRERENDTICACVFVYASVC